MMQYNNARRLQNRPMMQYNNARRSQNRLYVGGRATETPWLLKRRCSSNADCSSNTFCSRGVCDRARPDVRLLADVQEELARREEQRQKDREMQLRFQKEWDSKPWYSKLLSILAFVLGCFLFFVLILVIHNEHKKQFKNQF
jgi:hypothetical protein